MDAIPRRLSYLFSAPVKLEAWFEEKRGWRGRTWVPRGPHDTQKNNEESWKEWEHGTGSQRETKQGGLRWIKHHWETGRTTGRGTAAFPPLADSQNAPPQSSLPSPPLLTCQAWGDIQLCTCKQHELLHCTLWFFDFHPDCNRKGNYGNVNHLHM